MLSYAFQVLNEQGYKNVSTEKFNNVTELCAAILTKGISLQLKRGLGREYIRESDALSSIRGKIEINDMLPIMQTDIMLTKDEKTLIIDAKYYSNTTRARYDVRKLHSGNLYQIFTYVKNKERQLRDQPHEVSGMLLYAKTDETIQPNSTYRMSGNSISVKTLDLGCDFFAIATQLNSIIEEYFGINEIYRYRGDPSKEY